MPKTPDETVALSDLQMSLMRVLWTRGESSTAEVVEALAPQRALAHTTVATMLTRLEKRELVSARRDGKQLRYRPEVEESHVRRSMVGGLLSSLFGGDAKALVAHLLREDAIDPDDLGAVKRMLAENEKARGESS